MLWGSLELTCIINLTDVVDIDVYTYGTLSTCCSCALLLAKTNGQSLCIMFSVVVRATSQAWHPCSPSASSVKCKRRACQLPEIRMELQGPSRIGSICTAMSEAQPLASLPWNWRGDASTAAHISQTSTAIFLLVSANPTTYQTKTLHAAAFCFCTLAASITSAARRLIVLSVNGAGVPQVVGRVL